MPLPLVADFFGTFFSCKLAFSRLGSGETRTRLRLGLLGPRSGKWLSPLLRARFEVYRHFVEGNFALADREWEKGLAVIEKFQDAVLRERLHESWMEWQEEMNERRAVSNAPALEPI